MNFKRLIIFFVLLIPFYGNAQMHDQPINQPKYDHQKAHFGFCLGLNTTRLIIDKKADFKLRDSIYSIECEPVAGLNLGIISNLRISDKFDFRFIPTLSFAQRNMIYDFRYVVDSALTVKKIESTYLEFPFELKYKSARINNYRAYVLLGLKYSIDMISQAKVKQEDKDILKLKRKDYGYEVGIGFDFYLPYFKFSPEIKMYNGLSNLLVAESTVYADPIKALYAKTFAISFTFE
jgi:hypothetical protein